MSDDLRDQIAEAIGASRILRTSNVEQANAVMTVVQPELDRLTKERDVLKQIIHAVLDTVSNQGKAIEAIIRDSAQETERPEDGEV